MTTPALAKGVPPVTFTVTFPNAGKFKLVCLVHENMTGVVHVLDADAQLPHNQDSMTVRLPISDATYFRIAMAVWSRLVNDTASVRQTTHLKHAW